MLDFYESDSYPYTNVEKEVYIDLLNYIINFLNKTS